MEYKNKIIEILLFHFRSEFLIFSNYWHLLFYNFFVYLKVLNYAVFYCFVVNFMRNCKVSKFTRSWILSSVILAYINFKVFSFFKLFKFMVFEFCTIFKYSKFVKHWMFLILMQLYIHNLFKFELDLKRFKHEPWFKIIDNFKILYCV